MNLLQLYNRWIVTLPIMDNNLSLNGHTEEQASARDPDAISRLYRFTGALGTWFTKDENDCVTITLGLGPRNLIAPHTVKLALSSLSTLNFNDSTLDITPILHQLKTITNIEEMMHLIVTEILDKNPETHLIANGTDLPQALMTRALGTGRALKLAREVTNAAGSDMNPVQFATLANHIAEQHEMEIKIISGSELVSSNYPAIHAMGAGSRFPAQFIEMSYSTNNESPPIVLVGKGVTFDTGGLSLKTPEAMAGMRHDICGAATILGIMSVLKQVGCTSNVIGLFPVIENMVGPE
jgi:leucyl aminopeptidase